MFLLSRLLLLILLVSTLVVDAAPRKLRGVVSLERSNQATELGQNVEVTLLQSGRSVVTNEHGIFVLALPDSIKAGDPITLLAEKPGWVMVVPWEGATQVPADLLRELVEVKLFPEGNAELHERVMALALAHSKLAIIATLLAIFLGIGLLLYLIAPLAFLSATRFLKSSRVPIPGVGAVAFPAHWLFFGWLWKSERVLDAWVRKHIEAVRRALAQ
jgi:hypothetical protein